MHENRLAPVDAETILSAAKRDRAIHGMSLLVDAWKRAVQARPSLLREIVLAGTSLLCASLVSNAVVHGAIGMAAISFAALASSIAGFAFSAICGAMLFHLADDPVQVVQLMIVCSIANQAAMTWSLRRSIDWRAMRLTLVGGAIGLAVGVWILLHADRATYSKALGVFLLGYSAFMLFRKPVAVRNPHPAVDFACGVLSGITGGAAGFPSSALSIWSNMKGWDKTRQRALVQPFILVMQIGALLAISLARGGRATGLSFDLSYLMFIPASLLGTSIGLALYRRLSDMQFARAVNVLLLVSGICYVL
jgi:uncharacterized membrane protein YfcA